MMTLKCVVPGCKAEDQTLHRFPSPRTRIGEFKRWLEILHMDALDSLTPEQVYAVKRICSAHFDVRCKSPGNPRLHANAVPTIGLPMSQTLIAEEPVPGPSAAVHDVTVVHRRVPKAQKLYKAALHSRRQANKNYLNFKHRLEAAEEYPTLPHLKKPCLTLAAEKFFRKQIRQGKKHLGRSQFTQEEKTRCLTLLKNNPKSYSLLQKIFTLPDKQTLTRLLSRMTLRCGINQHLFEVLKKHVIRLEPQDKFCVLMFDEIRLQAQLSYNRKEDVVEGLVDTGRRRSAVFADHALVFMVRGIRRRWKQPVAFSFCQGATTSAELVEQVSSVLESLCAIGLRPVATVCDQAGPNVAAVNSLLRATEESYRRRAVAWDGGFFTVGSTKVFPLYDMPHLLTGIRNNMLSKAVRYTQDNQTMEAKWDDVVALYELDKEDGQDSYTSVLRKLTDAHVNPTAVQKRKVKLCSQVFSRTVAASMRLVGRLASPGLVPENTGTTMLILFLDKLFDSVNSSSSKVPARKHLRGPLKAGSAHVKFWHEAIKVLSSMEFIEPVSRKVVSRPPSVTHWIATLRGLQLLWKNLQAGGLKSLLLRNCNQDPLESFFAAVRSRGARNVTPSCTAFIAATKTLTLNNFRASGCVSAYCGLDTSVGALCTLGELLARPKKPVAVHEDPSTTNSFTCSLPEISRAEIATNRMFYSCGSVMKKLRPVFKQCKVCNTDLFASEEREHTNRQTRLKCVSYPCATAFVKVKKIVKQMLPKYCSHSNLCSNVAAAVQTSVDFTFLTCALHKERIREIFIKKTIELILRGWISAVNQILSGKGKVRTGCTDSIKKQALVYYKQKQKSK